MKSKQWYIYYNGKSDKNLSKCKMTEEEIREMLIQFKPVFDHLNKKK